MINYNSIYKFYYKWWRNIDKTLFISIMFLFSLGLFFSLVSTSLIASDKLDTNNYFFFFKHLAYISIGMIILIWKNTKVRNLFLIQFVTFLMIGIGTGVLIYPILDELAINTIPLDQIHTLLQKFKLLDSIRSFIAIISVVLLTFSIIKFNKSIYSKVK